MKIEKLRLKEYIAKEQFAWHEWDGVMNFTQGCDTPDYKEAVNAVPSCNNYQVITRSEMLDTSFHDLAEWSRGDNDVLVLGDDSVLICIPKSQFEKWFAQN